ncbi:Concanavalin A-like lectin/glucanase, subgroup [Cynara cardunculus var. scolymus]|uniref:non-specific serine/threonine protein kinase n=1 Tax=Cynara cardunculus var. scolymus TaxID=59895 RepID=A0A103Y3K5_CYNCS|nr:Concanavalin A-like lectin/glucanase, subgroup [Cynara cardunculus var. scolymus]
MCVLMFLHSLPCESTVSFPDTGYRSISNLNHDCCCSANNLGRITSPLDTSVSWTSKLLKLISFFGHGQAAVTWVMLLITLLNIMVYKLRQFHEISLGKDKKPVSLSLEHQCRQFLLAEMRLATNNFDQALIIGKGGFGKVYRGVIDHGATRVAIKRLDSRSTQGASEFWTEIKMLSKFRHSHLVSLIGYCDEFDEMMVVYEYVSGGNLGERLHKSQIMPDCLKAFVEIADKCLQTHPKNRPTMAEVVVGLEAALALQQIEICSPYGNQGQTNSYMKSGKITFSRMLRHMMPVKTHVKPGLGDVEPPEKKKRRHNLFLPSILSNKQVFTSKSRDTFQEFNFKWEVADSALRIFTLAGLKIATRNFNHALVVGEGAFGKVFKGWVDEESYVSSEAGSGMPIAVKKLNTDGYQGLEEWQAEVHFLGRLSHPNLVRLLGYCSEDKELLLVYEFMEKGSLENYIFKRGLGPPLSWSLQLKILIGVARGIAFLHTTENQIIFRDLKSSNILLDQDFNAKIADFGLAKHGPVNGDTHLSTMVMGTYGYAAPEYVATGHLNGKNDIYAFGVVLLEILTGLRVIDHTRLQKEQNLVEWARPMLLSKRKLKTIIDPNLGHDYLPEATFQCAALILKCTQPEPEERPSIEQVLRSLEHISGIKRKA